MYTGNKKKKVVGAKLRDNGMAQASWGNKIPAPKVYDEPTAYPQKAAWKSAKAASKTTVATRARYTTGVNSYKNSAKDAYKKSESKKKGLAYSAKIKKAPYTRYKEESLGSKTRNSVLNDNTHRYNTGDSAVKRTQAFKNAGKTGKTVGSRGKRDTIQYASDWDIRFGNWGAVSADSAHRTKTDTGFSAKRKAEIERQKRKLGRYSSWAFPNEAKRIKRKTGK